MTRFDFLTFCPLRFARTHIAILCVSLAALAALPAARAQVTFNGAFGVPVAFTSSVGIEFFQGREAAAGDGRELDFFRDEEIGVGTAVRAADPTANLIKLGEAEAVLKGPNRLAPPGRA